MRNNDTLLIISAVFPPEPVVSASISHDVATSISKNSRVVVLCPKPTRPKNFKFDVIDYKSSDFKVNYLDSYTYPDSGFIGRMRESLSFGIETARYVKEHFEEIDCIYANTWPLFAQYFIVREAKKRNIPILLHVQDVYPEAILTKIPFLKNIVKNVLLPFDRFVLNASTSVLAISDRMKSHLYTSRCLDPSKIHVIQNWQNEEQFIDLSKDIIEHEYFTFMYLGNIGPVAGLDIVIDAFLASELNNARLVIAGSGSMRSLLEDKVKRSSNTKIEFWSVPEGAVAKTQVEADVMLLPIKKGAALSSIPSKLPAYMFSAKPVIGSVDQDSDTAQAITRAKCGWVVPPESVENLSRAMIEAYQKSVVERNEMGLRGQKYALDHFSKSKNLPKLVNLIDGLITK